MITAVLFDMDGVLVDSERFITQAAIDMFSEKGVRVHKSDFLPFTGMGEDRFLGGVAEKYSCGYTMADKARTYEIYADLVKGRLFPLPGVHDFIGKCREKGLRLAVATSADKAKLEINLAESGLGRDIFDASVDGLQVINKKPDPEIFILASKKLGVSPGTCLVVEDAPSGIRAARLSGARCLALTTSFDAGLLHEAHWIAENLCTAPDEVLDW